MRNIFPIAILTALLAGACGGGDDSSGAASNASTSGGDTGGTQETTVAADCADVSADVIIDIRNRSFNPREVSVRDGGIVRWNNNDSLTHDVTSGEPGHSNAGALFDSGNLAPGASFCTRVSGNVEIDYFCEIHPDMLGEIKVGTAQTDENDDDQADDDANRDDSAGGSDDNRDRS